MVELSSYSGPSEEDDALPLQEDAVSFGGDGAVGDFELESFSEMYLTGESSAGARLSVASFECA